MSEPEHLENCNESYYGLSASIRKVVNGSRLQIKVKPDCKWNKVCALLDRIDDTTRYLDHISSSFKNDVFSFYNLLIYGNVVLDCLLELNSIFNNTQDEFKNKSEYFIKNSQLSDNASRYLFLNGRIKRWHSIVKPLTEKYTDHVLDSMSTSEKQSFVAIMHDTISNLLNLEYEKDSIFLTDVNEIEMIYDDLTSKLIRLVEFCDPGNIFSHLLEETIKLIAYPTKEWYDLSLCRLTKNNDNEKQSDYDYFKFLRSLCAIHPIDTAGHKHFLNPKSYCAYVTKDTSPDYPEADYCAIIYSERDFEIPIYVDQITNYLKNSIKILSTGVIGVIKRLSKKEMSGFKSKSIPSNNDDYNSYLKILYSNTETRYGHYVHIIKHWIRILNTHYSDPIMESILNEYKSELKKHIEIAHKQIQNMSWECEDNSLCPSEILNNGYDYYFLSKVSALRSSDEDIGNIWGHIDEEYLTEQLAKSVKKYLLMMEKSKPGSKSENLKEYKQGLQVPDGRLFIRYCLFNIMNPYVESIPFKMDYTYGDWHLYLQYQLALWSLKKKINMRKQR